MRGLVRHIILYFFQFHNGELWGIGKREVGSSVANPDPGYRIRCLLRDPGTIFKDLYTYYNCSTACPGGDGGRGDASTLTPTHTDTRPTGQ
jgi:hypothetical protein